MKNNTTTMVLVVALAVVAGLFSSTIFGLTGTKTDAQSSMGATGLITGHVTTEVRDADGNIKEYRQTDNLIVNNGENCASKLLFAATGGDAAGNTVCLGTHDAGFRHIALGTGTTAPADGNTGLETETAATGLTRAFSAVTWTNATGGTAATVELSNTFTNTSGGTVNVAESGLFNQTSTGGMFARQTFTAIPVGDQATLTVTWTINIGGTASI